MRSFKEIGRQISQEKEAELRSGGIYLAPPEFSVETTPLALPVQRQENLQVEYPITGAISGDWSAAFRSSPGKDPANPHENTIADIPKGTQIKITGKTGNWYEVEYDAQKGFVHFTMAILLNEGTKDEPKKEKEPRDVINPIVTAARGHVGSSAWAYDGEKEPYGPGTNKCNLFVFDVLNEAGFSVPMVERYKWGIIPRGSHPPLAGQ